MVGRRVVLAVQTVAELRFGALRAGWGDARREGLEREIARVDVVPVDDRLATVYAEVRDACVRAGHPLGAKHHDGDRWVAASALRHDLPLVTFDGVFADAPGLVATVLKT